MVVSFTFHHRNHAQTIRLILVDHGGEIQNTRFVTSFQSSIYLINCPDWNIDIESTTITFDKYTDITAAHD